MIQILILKPPTQVLGEEGTLAALHALAVILRQRAPGDAARCLESKGKVLL